MQKVQTAITGTQYVAHMMRSCPDDPLEFDTDVVSVFEHDQH